jgi:hypothetical protein
VPDHRILPIRMIDTNHSHNSMISYSYVDVTIWSCIELCRLSDHSIDWLPNRHFQDLHDAMVVMFVFVESLDQHLGFRVSLGSIQKCSPQPRFD